MKSHIKYLVLIVAILPYLSSRSQEKLEIEGAVILTDSEDPTPSPGTIRFNSNSNDFEGWNGLFWVSLSGFQFEIGQMIDQDGNTYPTVVIGGQEWMAQNLKTTTYRNKNPITLIGNDTVGDTAWSNANFGAYAILDTTGTGYPFYDQDKFGNLYNWYAVNDSRHLCPEGWHVPTVDDWTILTDFLGGSNEAGGKMKSTGTIESAIGLWYEPNLGAINSSGFTGLPGGYRRIIGIFNDIGEVGWYWSSTEWSNSESYVHFLLWVSSFAQNQPIDKRHGCSIRCVRD